MGGGGGGSERTSVTTTRLPHSRHFLVFRSMFLRYNVATPPYPLGFCTGGRGSSSSTAFPNPSKFLWSLLGVFNWKLNSQVSCRQTISDVRISLRRYCLLVSMFFTLNVDIFRSFSSLCKSGGRLGPCIKKTVLSFLILLHPVVSR